MEFSVQDIQALGEAHRKMDSGEMPYVRLDGQRCIMSEKCMVHFGLKTGQTIDHAIMMATLYFERDLCIKEIEKKEIAEAKPEDFIKENA